MKNKMILSLIILLTLCLSISVVSANENITDISTSDGGDVEVISSSDEIVKSDSTLSASNVNGYNTFSTKYSVNLESDGVPLASKQINITIDDVTYTKTADNDGQASVNVKLGAGTYDVL